MNNDKMLVLLNRWRDLAKRQKDLDHALALWVRDARTACGGDKAFVRWCQQEIDLTDHQCQDLLERVAVLDVVPDADAWRAHGGWRGLRPLAAVPSKRERVAVIEAAKSQGYAVSTVVRQRQTAQQAARPDIAPHARIPTPAEDAERFARFIVNRVDRKLIPADLLEALSRWSPEFNRRKAA